MLNKNTKYKYTKMNSIYMKQTPSTITSHNGDRKHNLNDVHRTSKMKQSHANNSKKNRKPKKAPHATAQEEQSVIIFQNMQEQVRNLLTCCDPGMELQILHHVLKPDTNALWLKCNEVKKDLILAFQRSYPSVRLEVFGSTVMGIAFKDSDFDFFIELSREPLNAKPPSVIGKAMNILRQSGNFTNFLPISHARVPILKCYHMRTGYQCDINFSDSYGILNSPIVGQLLFFDFRIYCLAVILKYWTKVHDCAGKNRISNYAIVWMLLFYLQQLPSPILPPIIDFQERVLPYFINGYNFAYDDRLQNRSTNQNRCSELLLGFFNFYKNFDFNSHVISPLYGKVFRKADILARKNVPEFHRYYEMLSLNANLSPMQFNKCICIQDPFEITHSIPGIIANLEFQKIMLKFEHAADVIDHELKTNGESTKLLLLMFDAENFNQTINQKIQRSSAESQNKRQNAVFRSYQNAASFKSTLQIKPTDYHLSIVRDMLAKKSTDANMKIDSQTINQSWCEIVLDFIVLILRDIFMLKIETAEENSAKSEMEAASSSSGKSTDNDNAVSQPDADSDRGAKVFIVGGDRDVFIGRKQSKKINAQSLNAEMSDSQARYKKNSWEIQLKVNIKLLPNTTSFDDITVEFQDMIKTKKNNSFKTFFTNFDQNLNHLLKICFVHKCANSNEKKPIAKP